ncbi:MAG: GIY-YIG nuclease family protein [Microcoleus sp.]
MGHVYILKARSTWNGRNFIKIGMTDRPDVFDRFEEIRSDWADVRDVIVSLYASAWVHNPTEVETYLHRKFKHYRLYNRDIWDEFGNQLSGDSEWFAMDDRALHQTVLALHSFSVQAFPWLGLGTIAAIGFAIGLWLCLPRSHTNVPIGARQVTVVGWSNVRKPNLKGGAPVIAGKPIAKDSPIAVSGNGEWLTIVGGENNGKLIHKSRVK